MKECCAQCGDLNEKEFHIINYVGQHQNVKMSEIAESFPIPLSTLTTIVDKLVARKFLSRYHSDEDRRVVGVPLAKNGKNTFATFNTQKQEISKKILTRFSEEQQTDLLQLLEKIPPAFN